ncbi:o-succinylbenzoate synthase [Phototrophicus methaneseepsis]|uniref:o-succinylbenzoate synthase n=1 Tax=Phototrophicus methaneseepsis TaxID=2710758 RepID=A0A7S8ECT9_9CHLR|nr:o-succinylbenzoate synthase [Phototrophicus methaneseepsis]QPC84618.1 o-succinylbenzoate synthase [Phototrophicus methaneseepsis]
MKPITIKDVIIHTVALPLVEPLRTSFGVEPNKTAVLIEVVTEEGVTGWGEAAVDTYPGYGMETTATAEHILLNFLIPSLVGKTIEKATEVPALLRASRGNHHTKAGIEAAVWDACAKMNDMRLADYFATFLPEGHEPRPAATVGVSIGIQPTVEDTLQIIRKRLDQGYQRIKLKIKRGWDVELAKGVREALPDITMMLDANSDYTLADAEHLKQLDDYNLLMIEQPLAYYDIYEHGKLTPLLDTPVCLDESIHTVNDLLVAIQIGAINILNLKPARVGGYSESLRIYRVCVEENLPLWIGGMLETGVGRAANVAFAALPGVTLPCDISATDRYFDPDITEKPFVLGENSTLAVPDGYGIGVEVQLDRLEAAKEHWKNVYPYVEKGVAL